MSILYGSLLHYNHRICISLHLIFSELELGTSISFHQDEHVPGLFQPTSIVLLLLMVKKCIGSFVPHSRRVVTFSFNCWHPFACPIMHHLYRFLIKHFWFFILSTKNSNICFVFFCLILSTFFLFKSTHHLKMFHFLTILTFFSKFRTFLFLRVINLHFVMVFFNTSATSI